MRLRDDQQRRELKEALRVHFILVFLVAATGSVAFVFWSAAWLPAAWASLVMVVYGTYAYRRAPQVSQTSDFADSFYYLGFTLTLVALIVVLVSLSGAGEPGETINAVLPQFGFALSTTLVGLLGRTVFTMFRPEGEATEERAERELREAFDDFTRSLQQLTAEADSFQQRFSTELETSVMSLKKTADGFHEIVEKTANEAKPLVEALSRASTDLQENSVKLDEAVSTLSGRVEESGEALEETTGSIKATLEGSADSVSGALRQVENEVEGLGATLEHAANSVNRLTDLQQELIGFSDTLIAVNESLEALEVDSIDELRVLRREIREVVSTASGIEGAINSFSREIRDRQSDVGQALKDWSDALRKVSRLQVQLQDESEDAALALVKVRKELAAGVHFLRATLESGHTGNAGGESHGKA